MLLRQSAERGGRFFASVHGQQAVRLPQLPQQRQQLARALHPHRSTADVTVAVLAAGPGGSVVFACKRRSAEEKGQW